MLNYSPFQSNRGVIGHNWLVKKLMGLVLRPSRPISLGKMVTFNGFLTMQDETECAAGKLTNT